MGKILLKIRGVHNGKRLAIAGTGKFFIARLHRAGQAAVQLLL